MKRSAPLRRRTRLRAVGRAGRHREARLRILRLFLAERSQGYCEVPWCRARRRLDCHHLVKRWRIPPDSEALRWLLHVCRFCHDCFDLPDGHRDALRAWREEVDGEAWIVFLFQGERLRRKLLADGRRLGPVERGLEESLVDPMETRA